MPKDKDKIWEHLEKLGPGSKIKCKYCKETFLCSVTRLKFHLGRISGKDIKLCNAAPDAVQQFARGLCAEVGKKGKRDIISLMRAPNESNNHPSSIGSSSQHVTTMTMAGGTSGGEGGQRQGQLVLGGHQSALNTFLRKKEKDIADLAIAKHFVANNIAFNVARTPEFIAAMVAVANHGPGYIPPSSETIRAKLLRNLKEEATEYVKEIRESWAETGCTIMSDGWKDKRNQNHINLLASSVKGTVFLCSESTKGKKKDAKFLADFIMHGIDEHVGRENVVQIITDNTSNYAAAGWILEERMPHVFKTSCAAHCLDLILEDFDKKIPKVRETIQKGRDIKNFIYKYTHVLDCMRVHTKGKELKRPTTTRFATNFLMLESIIKDEQALRFMVASNEWGDLEQTKSIEGKEVTNIIQNTVFWEDGRELIAVIEPLVRVLRMVDNEGATLGYVYEAIYRAKETIYKHYNGEFAKYDPYWEIIDKRWNGNLHHPIHSLAGLLNQHLYYGKFVKHDEETDKGISEVILKMFTSQAEKEAFSNQLTDYIALKSNIFTSLAKITINSKHPSDWWRSAIIVDFAEIRRVAIRLLSQPCSSSACERNWSAFEAAHTKKRNRLEPKTLNDLVFVRANLHLKKKNAVDKDTLKPIYLEHINAFPEEDDLIIEGEEGEGIENLDYDDTKRDYVGNVDV